MAYPSPGRQPWGRRGRRTAPKEPTPSGSLLNLATARKGQGVDAVLAIQERTLAAPRQLAAQVAHRRRLADAGLTGEDADAGFGGEPF